MTQSPRKIKPAQSPPVVNQLSDIAFLMWYYFGGGNFNPFVNDPSATARITVPKYFIRSTVVNTRCGEIFDYIWTQRGLTWGFSWAERRDFSFLSDEFKAILSCPNAAGIAYFLFQHKRQFGKAKIVRISLWGGQAAPSILLQTIVMPGPV
jgi:hypothetical protein